ncbi:hypothetical protein ACJJTC_012077 [Scirpophaga incertulas]
MADLLNPDLIWIEGRCYRVNDSNIDRNINYQEHDLYENGMHFEELVDEGDDDFCEIIPLDNNRFSTNLHVSRHYIGAIIGKKGAVKMRIERDTRTDIKIPKQGQTGNIIIYGSSASNVVAARRRINIIVISSRMKQRATHFISIPMNESEIIQNFDIFKKTILTECPSRGLDESIFIKSSKLHLTLGVMCLMDDEERLLASKLLTEARDKIIRPLIQECSPVKIKLKGLSYMNDDPKEIDVLYGCVEEEGSASGVLQRIADSLVDHFYKAGFMDKQHGRENVKLHVTLINSKYRSRLKVDDGSNDDRNSRQSRVTFDGSEILKRFRDYDFGTTELTVVHLSQRHSMGNDGYYQPTCVVSCGL